METLPSLCSQCRLIFSPKSFNVEHDDETIIKEYTCNDTLPDLPDLQRTVLSCALCNQLRKRITAYTWPATLLHESIWEAELGPEQEGISMLEVKVASAQAEITVRFDIFADPGSYASEHMRVRRRPPSTDRLSAKCIQRLHEKIEKCADIHWQCNPGIEEFWPSRLIDVGPADGSVDARLTVTSGRPEKYLAFSHCWGVPGQGVRMLKTTAATLESHMSGIPLSKYVSPPIIANSIIIIKS